MPKIESKLEEFDNILNIVKENESNNENSIGIKNMQIIEDNIEFQDD